jgi:hypothetical protein
MSDESTGYEIRRLGKKSRPVPIGLAEWRDLVQRTPGLRLAVGDRVAINPFTQQPMTLTNHGDAEIQSGDDWSRVFFWMQGDPSWEQGEGYIHFRTLGGGKASEDPAWTMAARLAEQLGAGVFEEEA